MNRIFNIIIVTAIAAVITSCNNKGADREDMDSDAEMAATEDHTHTKMTAKEFVSWCSEDDNRLAKEKEIADIKFRLSYLPAEAMAFLELRTEDYDLAKFEETSKDYTVMSYFNFRMQAKEGSGELLKYNLQSPAQYDARIKYMSFDMQNKVYVVQGNDTLLPGLFHFERTFEAAPYASVMFAFDNEKFNKNEAFTVVYDDRLFDKGFIKFHYNSKQLINLPTINEL